MIDTRISILLPLLFGFLGALPHIIFSFEIGTFSYLQYAWDENVYTHFALSGEYEMYRTFSVAIINSLFFLSSNNLALALILADVIIPFIVMVLAVHIAKSCGFNTLRSIFSASAFLTLSTAFLSFGDINFFGKFITKISPFAMADSPAATHGIIPNLMMTFFPLYRTPEPQASMIVQFAILLIFFREGGNYGSRPLVFLVLLCLILPFIYVSIGISLLLFMLCYSCIGLITRREEARYIMIFIITVLAAFYYAVLFVSGAPENAAVSFIYQSHLPIVSPSVIIGSLGLIYIGWLYRAELKNILNSRCNISNRHILAAACFAVPIITLNQQILTGVTIQARNWEFYSNYTFTAAGLLMMYNDLPRCCGLIAALKKLPANTLPLLLLLIIASAQIRCYARFLERGLAEEAVARLILQLRSDPMLRNEKILLDSPAWEEGILNRLGSEALPLVPGNLSLINFQSAIAAVNKTDYAPETMPAKEHGFLLFHYRDIAPDQLAKFISKQASKGSCEPEMLYLYWVRDCWGVLTDYRALEKEKILRSIPLLVDDYKKFRGDEERLNQSGNVIYITEKKIKNLPSSHHRMTEVSTVTIGQLKKKTVYAYREKRTL